MKKDAAALRQDVETLCTEDGRMVGSPGHEMARRFVRRRAEGVGLLPYGSDLELHYERRDLRGTNVVGALHGADRSLPPLLLGAHYDSVIAAPCADDNAAAVAILLAVAASLRGTPLRRDIVFAFFDAEEPPWFQSPSMGSVRFFEDQRDDRGTQVAVVLDLMGHDLPVEMAGPLPFALPGLRKLRELVFMTGAESHEALAQVVRETALPKRLRLIATRNENVGDMSDHHAFRIGGVPFLFFTCGRWPHYHEPTDTPDRLNYRKMARFTRYLEALVLRLAEADLTPRRPGPYEVDTVAFEIESLRSSLGALLPVGLRMAGIERLETRGNLDDLAARLLELGL